MQPTQNQCDCTAAPNSPVRTSRATMEYVFTGRWKRGFCSRSLDCAMTSVPLAMSTAETSFFNMLAPRLRESAFCRSPDQIPRLLHVFPLGPHVPDRNPQRYLPFE